MQLSSLVTYVAFVVALVAGGGLGLQRSRVAALRADREDDRARIVGLREDLIEVEKDRLRDKARITQLESDLRHAEALALREQKWTDLDSHLDQHHKAAMRGLEQIQQAIEALPHGEAR